MDLGLQRPRLDRTYSRTSRPDVYPRTVSLLGLKYPTPTTRVDPDVPDRTKIPSRLWNLTLRYSFTPVGPPSRGHMTYPQTPVSPTGPGT